MAGTYDNKASRKLTGPYGNPIQQSGGTGENQQQHKNGVAGILHRFDSSSSSSENDGQGGRQEKGLKEKVKEKLPGGHKDNQSTYSSTTTTTAGGGYGEHCQEKKGVMDKIKDKLPGGHN